MRGTLISLTICFITIFNAFGQGQEDVISAKSPINIGLDEVNKTFVPPALSYRNLKSGSVKECTINVAYLNFPEEAKDALSYAISIWEQQISSPVAINIVARWEYLEGKIIANGCPTTFHKNFVEAPLTDIYYPVALAEKLAGRELNGSKEADIECIFNSNKSWYFRTDGNTDATKYDFVTIALHEIAHGLGIAGFFDGDNGIGQFDNPTKTPSIYDFYVFNNLKQRIADNNLFTSPSSALLNQLTSNNLNFSFTEENNIQGENIYAPQVWNSGASIYHLKEANVNAGEKNELMSPFSYKGEAIHNPGEKTLHILSEIGWNAVTLKLTEIRDIEETAEYLSVKTNNISSASIDNSTLKMVFSKDYFNTKDSIILTYNNSNNQFEGSLPLNSHKGKVQYYYEANGTDNKVSTYPNNAPKNMLSFKIGADFYPPSIKHNPSKLVSNSNPEIELTAVATDNLGIGSVKVEYRINGIAQAPVQLSAEMNDIYKGSLHLPFNLNSSDRIEYRIIAEDNSIRKNKKYSPAAGYYPVDVFETYQPLSGYFNDFNSGSNDFTINDFDINTPAGFSSGNLHTMNPYPESEMQGEKYNLIAQLKYPIILEENGQMTFDEIVLVEPGEYGTNATEDLHWDYVIVEASKNNGVTWEPLTESYDSGINESWEMQFSSSLKSNMSDASGHENMFWQHTINLTENEVFAAGDTVLFRFRLASDNSVNGWGWAIDNLQIQNVNTANDEMFAEENINIYPNPFSNNIFIDCVKMATQSSVEILITDLAGKTVYRQTNYDVQFNSKLNVDLSTIESGIYLASITDDNFNTITKRIIKN